MAYEALTADTFIEKLKSGGYPSIAGARRAIGRSQWPEPLKEKCHAAINKKFGSEPAKAAPAKKAAKTVTKKVAKKVAGKPGRPKKVVEETAEAAPAKRGPGRPKKATTEEPVAAVAPRGKPGRKAGSGRPKVTAASPQPAYRMKNQLELQDAVAVSNSLAGLLTALKDARAMDPSIDIDGAQTIVTTAITNVKRNVRPYVGDDVAAVVSPEVVAAVSDEVAPAKRGPGRPKKAAPPVAEDDEPEDEVAAEAEAADDDEVEAESVEDTDEFLPKNGKLVKEEKLTEAEQRTLTQWQRAAAATPRQAPAKGTL